MLRWGTLLSLPVGGDILQRSAVLFAIALSLSSCARFGYDLLSDQPGGPFGDSSLPQSDATGPPVGSGGANAGPADTGVATDEQPATGSGGAAMGSDTGAPPGNDSSTPGSDATSVNDAATGSDAATRSDSGMPGSDASTTGAILTVVPRILTPGTNTNLSVLGTIDWAHWGLNDASTVNRKLGGSALTSLSQIGTQPSAYYNDSLVGYTWTNGTPAASANFATFGIWVPGVGNGYRLAMPADTTTRNVTIYVGAWRGNAMLHVALSDNSAAPFTDTSIDAHGMGGTDVSYAITYRAASPAQSLVIQWTLRADAGGAGISNVTWQAATVP